MPEEFYKILKARYRKNRITSRFAGTVAGVSPEMIRQFFNGFKPMPSRIENKLVKFIDNIEKTKGKTHGKVK
jgi:hypothetical protein